MKFWDSSAVVPLLGPEKMTRPLQRLYEDDPVMFAAAFFVAEARPPTLEFVSLDDRLLAAARREGFSTTRPTP